MAAFLRLDVIILGFVVICQSVTFGDFRRGRIIENTGIAADLPLEMNNARDVYINWFAHQTEKTQKLPG